MDENKTKEKKTNIEHCEVRAKLRKHKIKVSQEEAFHIIYLLG